jgi:hypothetical protein
MAPLRHLVPFAASEREAILLSSLERALVRLFATAGRRLHAAIGWRRRWLIQISDAIAELLVDML